MSKQSLEPKPKSFLRDTLLRGILPYLIAVVIAMIVAGIFIGLMGFNVIQAYVTILTTSFRTPNGFIQTLLKFIPLTLLALAFTVPQATGKFNIGGEGQFLMGAIGATIVGILLADLPIYFLLPLCLITGVALGLLWGFIAGWLLFRFNMNEILSTVLLNFVSFQLVDYICTSVWRDPNAGHPTTIEIGAGGFLPLLINNPPLNSGLIIALVVAAVIYIYTNRTTAGYDLVATGSNPRAARVFGINTKVMFVLSLALGGALAGLAGAIEVSGFQHRLLGDMHSNYKILGLIIGLIAKSNNLAVPFVAFFIAVLEVGASGMQRTMMIPVEMVFIVEALILLFVLLSDVVRRR